jgi:glycosyltransferase involved in cell wall biosynthesis
MRITYLHQYFNTPSMSGGTRSYEMARRLVARGHEVNLITSYREPKGRKGWFTTKEDGVRVHWLPVPYDNRMSFGARIRAFLRFALGACGRAAKLEADVIFATSTPLTIAIPGIWASRRRRVPMVFEVRDLWPELAIAMGALPNPVLRKAAELLERTAYRSSAAVVALSPGMKAGVCRIGYSAERVTVIPNSADLALFAPSEYEPTRFREAHPEIGTGPLVVYTGTLGLINGVDYCVEMAAAAKARGASIQFAVVGDGKMKPEICDLAKKFGVLGKNFHLLPAVSKAEMPQVLEAADLALSLFINLEPMWANSANKFFDALASGTPVGINYGGWQAELLKETGAGIVLPPEKPEAAAEQLIAFLNQPEVVASAGRTARQLAEERFDRNELAEELERVLLKVVKNVKNG